MAVSEFTLLELRQFNEGEPYYLTGKRYDYHAIRVAAAYAEGDLELTKKLIEEVNALNGTSWAHDQHRYLAAIGQVTVAIFLRDMQTRAPDEFGEIRDFWMWFSELAHEDAHLRSPLISCARHAALIYGEPLTPVFWKARGTLSASEEAAIFKPISWQWTYRSNELMGLLANGSFEWSSIVVGAEYRKQVMLEHYSRPEFVLDEIGVRGNVCRGLDMQAFRYEWMSEAAADPDSPWFAASLFALHCLGKTRENPKDKAKARATWIPHLTRLIENQPDDTAGYDTELVEAMAIILSQNVAYYAVVYPGSVEMDNVGKWVAKEYLSHSHPEVNRMAELLAKKIKERDAKAN